MLKQLVILQYFVINKMKGVGKGNTNNPNGRPVGTKNKLHLSIREKIIENVTDNLDDYFIKLYSLEKKDYIRCMTELLKLIIPRPLNEEESNSLNINSEIMKRLFNK